MSRAADPALIAVSDLIVDYRGSRGARHRAVDGVSLAIEAGRTVGLVGESGSGKSTIGNAILGLVQPTSGRIDLDGAPLTRRNRQERRQAARRIGAVFQDPFSSMSPARTVGASLAEALRWNLRVPAAEVRDRLAQVLEEVGMSPGVLERYPSQFSGGQLQRLAIARALVVDPDFLVCDEAVSALDLSVQAQVINLLSRLAESRQLSMLFISHDLSVVRHISDAIVVLRHGRIVEQGTATSVADHPSHPYTKALVLAAPVPDVEAQAERRDRRLAHASTMSDDQEGTQP